MGQWTMPSWMAVMTVIATNSSFLTVRLGIILVNNQPDAQFFFFIRLFQFSTRFDQNSAHHQENQMYQYNFWYMSPTQCDIYQKLYWYNWFSWWWALFCSKRVDNWNKRIRKKRRIVRQVGYLQELVAEYVYITETFDVRATKLFQFPLTFRHRASCVLGQAFHYSPENTFYIFNQQIYFIIWYMLDRASLI